MMDPQHDRARIFLLSFVFKIFLGSVFFGSVDFIVSLGQANDVLNNQIFNVPYFPFVSIYLLLSAFLTFLTPLPLGICFKLFPAFFSSLTAVLVYDIVRKRAPNKALAAGLLFGFSPVTIIVDVFHFQWDSIVLFFLILSFYIRDMTPRGFSGSFLFGVLFSLAVFVKPYALMFGLFAVTPGRLAIGRFFHWAALNLCSLAGFVLTSSIILYALSEYGYDLLERWEFIRKYGDEGFIIFGLPKTGLSPDFFAHRTSVMYAMALLCIPYHFGRLGVFEAIGMSFAMCLSVLGLAPQYLGWIVPFLIITQLYRTAAIYTFFATVFLLLYYANPEASHMHYENMGTFAPLIALDWLTPTIFYWGANILQTSRVIGNYLIPASAFICLISLVYHSITHRKVTIGQNTLKPFLSWKNGYIWACVFPIILAVVLYLSVDRTWRDSRYAHSVAAKFKWYSMEPYKPNPYFSVSFPEKGSPLNIVTLFGSFLILWCVASLKKSTIDDSNSNIHLKSS